MIRFVALMVVAVSFLFAGNFAAAQPAEGEFYRIKNLNSGKYLALGDDSDKMKEAQVVQRAQGKGNRQQWSFEKVGKFYRIINRQSGQALNVHSTEEDEPVFATDNGKNAQWSLEKVGENYMIKSRNSGLVVDVADESKERKAPVVQFQAKETRNQIFALEPVK